MTPANVSDGGPVLAVVRKFLLAIVLLGMAGTMAELILLNHIEDVRQWVPLVLLAAALIAIIWHTSTVVSSVRG